jgi:peptidoglycan/LPS O-acetylase OafA/YrhL
MDFACGITLFFCHFKNILDTIIMLMGSIITIISASCSFYLLERPFLKLKNKLSSAGLPDKVINQTEVSVHSSSAN